MNSDWKGSITLATLLIILILALYIVYSMERANCYETLKDKAAAEIALICRS